MSENVARFSSEETTQTIEFGRQLGILLQSGDVVCLQGDLGAGKTRMAQGIALGWGITERVTSPTFTLLNEYRGRLAVAHLDLYRLRSDEELRAVSLDEIFSAGGLTAIEWADRAKHLPTDYLAVTLEHRSPTRRLIRVRPHGARSRLWARCWARSDAVAPLLECRPV